jgi:glycosyltransferase involved in cell wall biosynthesis
MEQVLIIGPAWPLRGGLASFNQRLALEFQQNSKSCEIISFSLQYPNFLFPGTTQFSSDPAPAGITIHTWINSVNPLNWISVGIKLKKIKPDIIIVRFWLPFMGPALGTILRQVKKNRHTKIICIADNVIPHEKRPGDKAFTKYFLGSCDAFITMSEKVMKDLRSLETNKPARQVLHPLYDNFGEPVLKTASREKLAIDPHSRTIVFFGFIRNYKGLDLLLEAMADPRIKEAGISLLVAGEFYEDSKVYADIIREHGLERTVHLHTHFIPDEEVRYYICAADCIVQPYRNATQSGVTPLAYHFEKPMIVTNVGGLPAMVPDKQAGLVCEPNAESIADAILEFYTTGEDHFIPFIKEEKKKYSWSNLVTSIEELAAIV